MFCSYGTAIIVLVVALHLDNIKFAHLKKSIIQRSKSLENKYMDQDIKYSRDITSDPFKTNFINANLTETKTVFTKRNSYSRNDEKITSKWDNIKYLISQLKDRADEIEERLKKLRNNKGIRNSYEPRPLFDKGYKHHVKVSFAVMMKAVYFWINIYNEQTARVYIETLPQRLL